MKTILTTHLFFFFLFPCFSQNGMLILDQNIMVSDLERTYHIFLPEDPVNAPLVFLFHGHSSTNSSILGLDGEVSPYKVWLDIAEEKNIILLIPNGYYSSFFSKGWNDCRTDALTNSEEDDVLFVSLLIDEAIDTYQADPNRVYVNGTSNGGHLCIRLAEELPEKIAAFAAIISANAVNSECMTSGIPISALFMNGTEDEFLPYEGGEMSNNRGVVYSAESTVNYWKIRNETDLNPIITILPNSFPNDGSTVTKYEYLNGVNNTCVSLYEVSGGGHAEPSSLERYGFPTVPVILGNQNGDIEMANEVWAFFENKYNIVLGSTESFPNDFIRIFPNPIQGVINIKFEGNQSELRQIFLINVVGTVIGVYEGTEETIQLHEVPSGLYFLRFDYNDHSVIRGFFKY